MAGEVTWSPKKAMRQAALAIALGLLAQLGASFHWTPITFVISAAVGLPLVAGGALWFLGAVFRMVKSKGAF